MEQFRFDEPLDTLTIYFVIIELKELFVRLYGSNVNDDLPKESSIRLLILMIIFLKFV